MIMSELMSSNKASDFEREDEGRQVPVWRASDGLGIETDRWIMHAQTFGPTEALVGVGGDGRRKRFAAPVVGI